MKGAHAAAIVAGLAADLVERQQAVEAIQRGVLDSLGGDRRGDLLELHGEGTHAAAQLIGWRRQLQQQRRTYEIEHRRLGRGAAPPGAGDRPFDVAPVAVGNRCRDVSPVDRETGDDVRERGPQAVESEVARAPVGTRDPRQLVGSDVQLRGQRAAQHQLLALVRHVPPLERLVDDCAVHAVHARAGGGIDQHAVDDVGEVVTGLAVHRPFRRQVLEGGGDLLDDQVQRARAAPAADGADVLLQAAKIPGRVVQPVRVVDAQAVDPAGGDQLQHQAVRDFEDRFVFDPQRRQIVHIEKPPVVDIFGRDAPVGELIGLQFEQLVQRIEARRLRRRAAEAVHRRFDRGGDRRIAAGKHRQALLVELLLAAALCHLFRGERLAVGQRRQRAPDVLELGVGDQRRHAIEDPRVGARIERQAMRLVIHGEGARARLEAQLELAALEHRAVEIRQHRHQHLVGAVRVGRRPVDVEERGIPGCLAVLQHVHPPGVVGAEDADMIRHDVDDVTHAVRAQGRHEQLEVIAVTDLRVEGVVVDHVVAVGAAGAGAEIRRAVHVADSERGQIRNDRRRIAEREAGVELHPVGGARNDELSGVGGRRAAPRRAAPLSAIHRVAPGATRRSRAQATAR